MRQILIASSNEKKAQELQALLEGFEIISLKDFKDVAECAEHGLSFQENALTKAHFYFDLYQIPCISDDSGLVIDYLNGLPGIHSARFLKNYDYRWRCEIIIGMLKDIKRRQCHYECCCAYYDGKNEYLATGKCFGEVATESKGSNGFGYDPLFYIPELKKTMAELNPGEKNAISHRGKALKGLVSQLV